MIDFNDPFNGIVLMFSLLIAIGGYIAIFGKNTKDKNPSKSSK